MSLLASTVMDRSAALLNDTALSLFSYTVQLPYLKIANDTFSDKLIKAGIPLQKKVATTKTIAVGTVEYTPLPSDFLVPQNLWERPTGQTIDWIPMVQRTWVPEIAQAGINLEVWQWANEQILFLGATQSVDVKLEYERILTAVTTSGSSLEISTMSNNFLAHLTASLCARFIGRNKTRADELKGEAYEHLDDLLNIQGKQTQAMPLRRRGFKLFGIRRYR